MVPPGSEVKESGHPQRLGHREGRENKRKLGQRCITSLPGKIFVSTLVS